MWICATQSNPLRFHPDLLSAVASCEATSKVNPFLQMISLQSQYVMEGLGKKMLLISIHEIQSVPLTSQLWKQEAILKPLLFPSVARNDSKWQESHCFPQQLNIRLGLSATCTNSHMIFHLKCTIFCEVFVNLISYLSDQISRSILFSGDARVRGKQWNRNCSDCFSLPFSFVYIVLPIRILLPLFGQLSATTSWNSNII